MAEARESPTARRPGVAAVAASVLNGQVREARVHVAGALDGSDPEDLHDLRVAVRRMRAALRLFEKALPAADGALEEAREGLRATGATLGRARDLDVQVGRLKEWVRTESLEHDPAAARAVQLLLRDRANARRAMRRHLVGGPFEQRMSQVEAAARAARAATPRRTAARLLRRPSRLVQEAIAAARAEPSDPALFHALRIDVKRLRYAIEFLEPSLPLTARPLLRQLRAAQEALGALQDSAVEQGLATRLMERARDDAPVRELLALYRDSQGALQRAQLALCRDLLDSLEASVRALRERL